uniref:MSP domain-containing protein n=1 Tax=Meloidogyne hapla TaxID=6305 RepID=A0A1I8BU60_MELHA
MSVKNLLLMNPKEVEIASVNSTVEEQFIKYSIVPDIIPKAPKNLLKLVFNNGSKDFEANLGKYIFNFN